MPSSASGPHAPSWLRWTAVTLFAGTLLLTLLIATSIFDPQPNGALQQSITLAPQSVTPQGGTLTWLDIPLPNGPFSARLTAAHVAGPLDSAYGLALGGPENHTTVAVSPTGYVSMQHSQTTAPDGPLEPAALLPWQTWPHVVAGGAPNEIWVDVNDTRVRVHINRELLWVGTLGLPPGQFGLVAENFADGEESAVIDFQTLEIYR